MTVVPRVALAAAVPRRDYGKEGQSIASVASPRRSLIAHALKCIAVLVAVVQRVAVVVDAVSYHDGGRIQGPSRLFIPASSSSSSSPFVIDEPPCCNSALVAWRSDFSSAGSFSSAFTSLPLSLSSCRVRRCMFGGASRPTTFEGRDRYRGRGEGGGEAGDGRGLASATAARRRWKVPREAVERLSGKVTVGGGGGERRRRNSSSQDAHDASLATDAATAPPPPPPLLLPLEFELERAAPSSPPSSSSFGGGGGGGGLGTMGRWSAWSNSQSWNIASIESKNEESLESKSVAEAAPAMTAQDGEECPDESGEGSCSSRGKKRVDGSDSVGGGDDDEHDDDHDEDDDEPPVVLVRHFRESDLPQAVGMCVDEFGSYSYDQSVPSPSTLSRKNAYVIMNDGSENLTLEKVLEPLWRRYENWAFSCVVRLGLSMRLARSRDGFEGKAPHDHNVICLVEKRQRRRRRRLRQVEAEQYMDEKEEFDDDDEDEGDLVGIAELSLQPPIPTRNAPPYVLPLALKKLVYNPDRDERLRRKQRQQRIDGSDVNVGGSDGGGGDDGNDVDAYGKPPPALGAYVSNVLVRPDRRGRGYGQALVSACEGLASSWNCTDVRLHVDADPTSGMAAQRLYRKLGYRPVVSVIGCGGDGGREVGGKGGGANGATEKEGQYARKWIGPDDAERMGIYVVEGVPLLYMRKNLASGTTIMTTGR